MGAAPFREEDGRQRPEEDRMPTREKDIGPDISKDESRTILAVATDVRPDENVHHDPALGTPMVSEGRPVTAEESRRIMALATDMRPFENVHPGEDDGEADG